MERYWSDRVKPPPCSRARPRPRLSRSTRAMPLCAGGIRDPVTPRSQRSSSSPSACSSSSYFLPAIVVLVRRPERWQLVGLVDLLAAWTVIGWVVALVARPRPAPPRFGCHRAAGAFSGWKVVVGRVSLATHAHAAIRCGRSSGGTVASAAVTSSGVDDLRHLPLSVRHADAGARPEATWRTGWR